MREITLRQIEVIRAVMLRGTVSGAAEHLGVSAPGISRLLRHTEESLGLRLFDRQGGLFVPAIEAQGVFEQIGTVFKGVENLQLALETLDRGVDVTLSFASSPSAAQFIAARAIRALRARHPDLFVDLNILKIEETLDYLLLERGEFVVMSSPMHNPGVLSDLAAEAPLVAILPDRHPLAALPRVSVHDLAREPMIGVDPRDPYGALLAAPFREAGLTLRHSLRGRFAQSVVNMVQNGLGVAVIDAVSVADPYLPGLVRRPLVEPGAVAFYVLRKKDRVLSGFAETAIREFRRELRSAAASAPTVGRRD